MAKVAGGLEWLHSPTSPLLLGYETQNYYKKVRKLKSRPVTFLIVWSSYEYLVNILFIIKVKILVLIEWSYRFPPTVLTIDLKSVIIFKNAVQSLLGAGHFGIRFWSHT